MYRYNLIATLPVMFMALWHLKSEVKVSGIKSVIPAHYK